MVKAGRVDLAIKMFSDLKRWDDARFIAGTAQGADVVQLTREQVAREREFFVDNLLVRIHFIIVMTRWTSLAPLEFEFPFPGSLTSIFLYHRRNGRCITRTGAQLRRSW